MPYMCLAAEVGVLVKQIFIFLEACNFQTRIINHTVKINYEKQASYFLTTAPANKVTTQHHKCGISNSQTLSGDNTGLRWYQQFYFLPHHPANELLEHLESLCVYQKAQYCIMSSSQETNCFKSMFYSKLFLCNITVKSN